MHRDVKPDNILLVGGPETPSVRVVDFGFAKVPSHESSYAGTALGTPAYMAPEQVLSDPVDARSDVYSLGVVIFRSVTGYLPFATHDDLVLLANQLLLPPPPPSWLADRIDPRLERLIVRALRKRPENRYPDMAALLVDLRRVLGELPDDPELPDLPVTMPDVYVPRTPLARQAARHFCQKLGVPIPDWLPPD